MEYYPALHVFFGTISAAAYALSMTAKRLRGEEALPPWFLVVLLTLAIVFLWPLYWVIYWMVEQGYFGLYIQAYPSTPRNTQEMELAIIEAHGDYAQTCDFGDCLERHMEEKFSIKFTPPHPRLPFDFYFCSRGHLLKAMKEWKLIEVSRET